MMRMSKIENYMEQARIIAMRSPCSRRKFGAIIVRNGSVVGSGYNGSAKGCLNCGEDIPCLKDLYREDHYSSYKYCPAVHAEDNAISATGWERTRGGTMFLAPADDGMGYPPCHHCRAKIINAELEGIWYKDQDESLKYLSGIELRKIEDEWMMKTMESAKEDYIEEILESDN